MTHYFRVPDNDTYYKKTLKYNDRRTNETCYKTEDSKYDRGFIKEQTDTLSNCHLSDLKWECPAGSSISGYNIEDLSIAEGSGISMQNENTFSDTSQNLLYYYRSKITPRHYEVPASLDNLPSRVVTELNRSKQTEYFGSVGRFRIQSTDPTIDAISLTALESFIKNAMDESIAKLKEEICKAIDEKLESMRSGSASSSSSSAFNVSADPSTCTLVGDMEERSQSSVIEPPELNDPSPFYSSTDNHSDTSDSTFTSGSINIIEKKEIFSTSLSSFIIDENFQSINSQTTELKGESFNTTRINDSLTDASIIELSDTRRKQGAFVSLMLSKQIRSYHLLKNIQNVMTNILDNNLSINLKEEALTNEESKNNLVCSISRENDIAKFVNGIVKILSVIIESLNQFKEDSISNIVSQDSANTPLDTNQDSKCFSQHNYCCGDTGFVEQSIVNEIGSSIPNASKKCLKLTRGSPKLNVQSNGLREDEFTNNIGKCPIVFSYDTEKTGVSNISFTRPKKPKKECGIPTENQKEAGYIFQNHVKSDTYQVESIKMLEKIKDNYLKNLFYVERIIIKPNPKMSYQGELKCQTKTNETMCEREEDTGTPKPRFNHNLLKSKDVISESICQRKFNINNNKKLVSMKHRVLSRKDKNMFISKNKRSVISIGSTVIGLLDISIGSKQSWIRKLSSFCTYKSFYGRETNEKGNFFKRLYFVTLKRGNKSKIPPRVLENHLVNIYNAICLDFVTDHVYRSVMFVSQHLRDGTPKTKELIMRRWVKICNKTLNKDKKYFTLDYIYQIWVNFRSKISQLRGHSEVIAPHYFHTLTFPCEDNRYIKEQVIQKYARDILEYISDPRLYKCSLSTFE